MFKTFNYILMDNFILVIRQSIGKWIIINAQETGIFFTSSTFILKCKGYNSNV